MPARFFHSMADISSRRKWLFWSLISTVFLFAAVPSLVLLEKAEEYYRFMTGWEPRTLKQMKLKTLPHRREAEGHDEEFPAIEFVEFRLDAPSAERVGLAGDFNRWRPESLPLAREGDGPWTVIVPLPPGTYHYGFDVDGVWTLDPDAEETARRTEREASVKRIARSQEDAP
ncbi:MAG: glycogen-binding domain-containing protein [Elusimicrobiota bacterium]